MRSPPPSLASTPRGVATGLADRQRELLPFTAVGVACVLAGGLVAAATSPAPTEHTSWAAAYLVLVGGVAQVGLGLGQAMFTARTSTPVITLQTTGWNLGNAAVLTGTLLGDTAWVDLGGALLLVTLGLLSRSLISTRVREVHGVGRWCLHGYRLLVLTLLVSIPVGLLLAGGRS